MITGGGGGGARNSDNGRNILVFGRLLEERSREGLNRTYSYTEGKKGAIVNAMRG